MCCVLTGGLQLPALRWPEGCRESSSGSQPASDGQPPGSKSAGSNLGPQRLSVIPQVGFPIYYSRPFWHSNKPPYL